MMVRIGELCHEIGRSHATVWRYMKEKRIRFYQDKPGSHCYFDVDEVKNDLYSKNKTITEDKTIIYVRVSTKEQINDLNYQTQLLEQYCAAKGWSYEIISDIGGGLNFNRKGLQQLLEKIFKKEVDNVVINYKDRLARFGYELIEQMCKCNNVNLISVTQTVDIPYTQELTEDILSVITHYSSKLYGSRSHKNKKIVEENKKLWK